MFLAEKYTFSNFVEKIFFRAKKRENLCSDGMNRFGKVPSSEIIRQAKQEIYGLVDTKRPETPRHPNLTQEKWDYYGGSGDKHTLDKCKFHALFGFLVKL